MLTSGFLLDMIAHEVLSFKAKKQGLPPLQLNTGATNIKRKDSLSANDRETLERSRDVAKENHPNTNDHRHSSSIAATASHVNQDQIRQDMDVDALERELSGAM